MEIIQIDRLEVNIPVKHNVDVFLIESSDGWHIRNRDHIMCYNGNWVSLCDYIFTGKVLPSWKTKDMAESFYRITNHNYDISDDYED